MPRLVLAAVALLATALPAQADQASEDADAIAACMAEAWPRDARALCAGAVSSPCQLALGNETTENMNACLMREADAWNLVMERQMPDLMRRAEEVDAANAGAEEIGRAHV